MRGSRQEKSAGGRIERFSDNYSRFAIGLRAATIAAPKLRKQVDDLLDVACRGAPVNETKPQRHPAAQPRRGNDRPACCTQLLHQGRIPTIQLVFIPFSAALGPK